MVPCSLSFDNNMSSHRQVGSASCSDIVFVELAMQIIKYVYFCIVQGFCLQDTLCRTTLEN